MSSTSDLPKISKSEVGDKRKPSTAGSLKGRKQSALRNPSPPKSGLPKKSPRKTSRLKTSGSEDDKSLGSSDAPETRVNPTPAPPTGSASKKGAKKKNSTLSSDGINLLASKSASGATKADIIVDMFQQNVAAWKIRFFLEVVCRKRQAAKHAEEKATWKKQVKILHKKYTDSKEELSKLKASSKESGGPAAQAAAAAVAVSKAESARVGTLEAELIALRAEKRELEAKLERSAQRSVQTPPSNNIGDATPSLDALRDELDSIRTKLYEMTQEKNALTLELEKKNLTDNSSEAKLDQANETIKLLGDALQEFKTRSSVFDEAAKAKASERENVFQELKNAEEKIKSLEAERDDLTIRTEKSTTERRSLERLVTEITVNMHSREKRVAEFKAEAEAKTKLIDDMTFKLNNHKVEMDMMAKRAVNSEAIQRNAQMALVKSRASEERALMRTADLEAHVAKLLKNISSAKQYSELLEEQMSATKKQAHKFEQEVHSKLAAAQKAAEESEQAASAYLQGSLSQRGSVNFVPSVTISAPDDDMNDRDLTLDELEYAATNRVMNGSVARSAGNKIGSPFPSGRTYGLPNYASSAHSGRGTVGHMDSFATGQGGSISGDGGKNPVEERLVALVSVLENRIDKIDYMTQLMEEENLGDEDIEDDIILGTLELEAENPELEARWVELEQAEEQKKKKAEDKLLVLSEHKSVLQKQEAVMLEKVALAQSALDQKKKELSEIKGDLSELQTKMSVMEDTNLKMLAELQAWEDEVIATSGEPPTDAERLERAGKLLEGDKQLHNSFELTQEVAKEIESVDSEVVKLQDALSALLLQKDVLSTLLNDHVKLEDGVRNDIKKIEQAAEERKDEALRKAEVRAQKKRELDEKVAVREKKKKLLEEKRAARVEKLNSFKKVEIPAVLSQSMAAEKSAAAESRNNMSAMARSLPEDRYGSNEEREITAMANNVHHVGDRISDLLASINNISNRENGVSAGNSVNYPHQFQGSRDEDVHFHYAGAEDSTFGGNDNDGGDYAYLSAPDPEHLVALDHGNVNRHPQQLKAYERVNEYERGSNSPFDYSDNPQEMADRMIGVHEHLKGLAYQVGECRLCLDRVTYHIKPRRLEAIQNWARAFEEQWGRRPGPADCRSAGSWPLIEAYIRTQRKEYEMYLEIQSLCNEGRFQLKSLQTMQTNYKLLLKSIVSQGKDLPVSNLAAHYDESKLPVTSDDIYELHAAFAPLMPSVFDDPVKTMFGGDGYVDIKPGPNGERSVMSEMKASVTSHHSAARVSQGSKIIQQIYPEYDPKDSVFSARGGDNDMIVPSISDPYSAADGSINFSLSLDDDGPPLGVINETSQSSTTTANTAEKSVQRNLHEEKKRHIRSHIEDITGPPPEEIALDELYNSVEDAQGELDEALSLLQDAKEEYRRQLSRQEFATRELEAWEVAFCQKNPGKVPGKLNEDEKRFGGGGSLYDTLEKQVQESETQRRRVEALVDIAVEKQLLVDDKTEELRSLQAKYAEINRKKDARGKDTLSNKPMSAKMPYLKPEAQKVISSAPAHGVINPAGLNTEGPRRMSMQDMVVLDAGPAGWKQAKEDVISEISRIKSEISVVETFIGPCEDSLEQFKQRKKKLKQMANFWIDEYKQNHNNREPTEEEKKREIGAIYLERSEIQVREQLLNSQRDQALEILDKLNKVLEQKETRVNLINSNLSPQ